MAARPTREWKAATVWGKAMGPEKMAAGVETLLSHTYLFFWGGGNGPEDII